MKILLHYQFPMKYISMIDLLCCFEKIFARKNELLQFNIMIFIRSVNYCGMNWSFFSCFAGSQLLFPSSKNGRALFARLIERNEFHPLWIYLCI